MVAISFNAAPMALSDLPPDQIRAYIAAVREFLRNRVQHNYDSGEVPSDQNERAVWYWSLLVGVFAHEVSGSAVELSLRKNWRSIAILNRSLFEYWVRLKFYNAEKEAGYVDIEKRCPRFKAIAEAFPDDWAEVTISATDFEEAFSGIGSDAGKFRTFASMITIAMENDDEVYKAAYTYYYSLMSATAHAGEAAFFDLSRDADIELPQPGAHVLDWTSTRYTEADLLGVTASFTSYILALIEAISKRGCAFGVLRERFPRAVREVFG
jgi:hypothetical protein